MTLVKEVIERAYAKVNGEYEVVADGSDDFRTYLNVLNEIMETWATTPYIKWQSLYKPDYRLPTNVTANTFLYTIPTADADRIVIANSPFDSVYFINNAGVTVAKYKVTDQALFDSTTASDVCAFYGDGLHLKSVPDSIVGTSIRLPVYMLPPRYTMSTQTVKVNSVTWLITAMAAFICDASPVPFIARNAEKFAKQADVLLRTMKSNNRQRQHLTIKRAGRGVDDQRFTSLSQAINAGVGIGGGGLADSIDGGTF